MTENSGLKGEGGVERRISMSIGVVARRRKIEHKWAEFSWKAIAVLPGAAELAVGDGASWHELSSGEDWTDFYAGALPLTLYRTDTEAYRDNLASTTPSVFVVMRKTEDGDPETAAGLVLAAVTASPYEGQDYLDNGEDIVEAVPMPPPLVSWMADFVERHHVEEQFVKRQRRPATGDDDLFATGPIFERRRLRGRNEEAS